MEKCVHAWVAEETDFFSTCSKCNQRVWGGGKVFPRKHPMTFAAVDTIDDLRDWVTQFMPDAVVQLSDNDIIIKTGFDISMGGYLHSIKERENE